MSKITPLKIINIYKKLHPLSVVDSFNKQHEGCLINVSGVISSMRDWSNNVFVSLRDSDGILVIASFSKPISNNMKLLKEKDRILISGKLSGINMSLENSISMNECSIVKGFLNEKNVKKQNYQRKEKIIILELAKEKK